MTTYALSLLTDRQLLIKIDKPCKLEKSIEPNEIDWAQDVPNFDKLSQHKMFIYRDYDYVKNVFIKENFLNYHSEKDLIIVRTGLNLVKHLTINEAHHEKIEALGYSVKNFSIEYLLHTWYKKLFKFNSYLEIKYQKLLKASKPTKNTKVICAQLRIGSSTDFQFTSRNSSRYYWDTIKQKFLTNITDYKLFITTDVSNVIDEAVKEFGSDKLIGFKSHSSHIDFVEKMDNDKKCIETSELFIDFFFLGKCDMGVISQSGFGLYGILNRENKNLDDFYVYSNPTGISKSFWERKNLTFIKYSPTLIYLEDSSFEIKFPNSSI